MKKTSPIHRGIQIVFFVLFILGMVFFLKNLSEGTDKAKKVFVQKNEKLEQELQGLIEPFNKEALIKKAETKLENGNNILHYTIFHNMVDVSLACFDNFSLTLLGTLLKQKNRDEHTPIDFFKQKYYVGLDDDNTKVTSGGSVKLSLKNHLSALLKAEKEIQDRRKASKGRWWNNPHKGLPMHQAVVNNNFDTVKTRLADPNFDASKMLQKDFWNYYLFHYVSTLRDDKIGQLLLPFFAKENFFVFLKTGVSHFKTKEEKLIYLKKIYAIRSQGISVKPNIECKDPRDVYHYVIQLQNRGLLRYVMHNANIQDYTSDNSSVTETWLTTEKKIIEDKIGVTTKEKKDFIAWTLYVRKFRNIKDAWKEWNKLKATGEKILQENASREELGNLFKELSSKLPPGLSAEKYFKGFGEEAMWNAISAKKKAFEQSKNKKRKIKQRLPLEHPQKQLD